jgi:hypothetical protein
MNMKMDFREAVDVLAQKTTNDQIAAATGSSPFSIKQARLHDGSPGHRQPPAGWEQAIARLARERAAQLLALADRLGS